MKLRLDIIPEEILSQYNFRDIAVDGWVYCEIKKGMYGLPHAGKIANDRLVKIYNHMDTRQSLTLPAFVNITLETSPSHEW